jgi:hypothetical protein
MLLVRLDEPSVVIEPMHGVVVIVLPGAGTPTSGLMPALFISVAPSGIAPPSSLRVPGVPGIGDAVPADETTPVDGKGQPVVEPMPPPSNDEVMPDVPDSPSVVVPDNAPPVIAPDTAPPANVPEAALPIIPVEDELVPRQLAVGVVGPNGAGPTPPGLISVAPNGMPVGRVGEVAPAMPSGEVIPIPGIAIPLCARPASHPKRIRAAAMNNRRI